MDLEAACPSSPDLRVSASCGINTCTAGTWQSTHSSLTTLPARSVRTDSQYHIIPEYQHKSMRDCRQKHIALLDIRRNHLRRTNNPVYTLFQAHMDFASTLGKDKMSNTAWTGMLSPALLEILVEANKVADLDGAKAYRCLLRQVNYKSRDLFRARYLRMREIRGESRTTLHYTTLHTCKTLQTQQD